VARIRRDIELTRAELSDTLGELQDRLRPKAILNQAGSALTEAVGSRAQFVAGYVQVHPKPAAMAVGGLIWWLAKYRRNVTRGLPVLGVAAAATAGYHFWNEARASNGTQWSGDDDGDEGISLPEWEDDVEDPRRAAGEFADTMKRVMHERPIAVGLVALAAGALAGFAFPVGQSEQRVLDTARHRLVDAASRAAGAALMPY
jgi:hypothetical protein